VSEGELDLISSFRVGIKNIVAIKGSAFTVDQAKLLGRYTKEVVLALDTDFAGVAAAIRGIKILEDEGFDIKVALLGMYKDPDEAAIANPDFYKEKVKDAVGVWDFVIDSIIAKYDKDSASGKRKISKELTPILASIGNKIIQEHYVNKLAKLLEVSEEAVISEVEKVSIPGEKKGEQKSFVTEDEKSINEVRQEKFVSLILKIKPELLKDEKVKILITVPILKRLIEEFKVEDFGKSLPKELFEKFGDLVLSADEGTEKEIKAEINELYKILSRELLKQELLNSKESHESGGLQGKLKDLDSDKFERIID